MSRKRKADNVNPENPETTATTKRTRRGRSKRGVLEGITEMPLDVLLEIFRYLNPMDMLNLTRTAKVFRQYLMARSAEPLWKTARMNIRRLPDCPSHLSEPAYANLVFDTHCQSCWKPNVKTVFWALSARYCPNCRQHQLITCKTSSFSYSDDNTNSHNLIVLFSDDSSGKYHWHRRDDPEALGGGEYNTLDEEGKEAHKLRIKRIMRWAAECEQWARDQVRIQKAELEALRKSRFESVISKLRAAGWSKDLDRMEPGDLEEFRNYVDPMKVQPFTDRVWKLLRHGIEQHLSLICGRRREEDRIATLVERCSSFELVYRNWHGKQQDKSILPRAIDLMRRSEVRAIIELDIGGREVSEANFEVFTEKFADWAADWKADCDDELRELVRKAPQFKDKLPDGVDPLSLASVVFSCTKCQDRKPDPDEIFLPALYPAVLTHDCLYEETPAYKLDDSFDRAAVSVSHMKCSNGMHSFWSCKSLEVDVWSERAAGIIKVFEQDPETTTRDEMDAVDHARVYCDDCHPDSSNHREIMSWRHALQHHAIHDIQMRMNKVSTDETKVPKFQSGPRWTLVIGEDILRVVRQKEIDLRATMAKNESEHQQLIAGPWYDCNHCTWGRFTPFRLTNHLNRIHHIDDFGEGDFYRSTDAEMSIKRPTMLLHPSLKKRCSEDDMKELEELDYGRAVWYDFSPTSAGSATIAVYCNKDDKKEREELDYEHDFRSASAEFATIAVPEPTSEVVDT